MLSDLHLIVLMTISLCLEREESARVHVLQAFAALLHVTSRVGGDSVSLG